MFNLNREVFKNFFFIYLAIFLSSIPYGMIAVFIALKMNLHVKSEVLISLSSATQIIAGVYFSKYLPGLAKRFGIIQMIHISSITAAIATLLMYKYVGYLNWLLVIFLFGASLFSFSTIRQTITLDVAPPSHKALLVSIGGMFMSLGNAIGPFVLKYIGSEGFMPYLVAASFYLISILPVTRIQNITSFIRAEKGIGIFRYIYNSPKIMLAGFTFSYVQASANAFLIIYGIRIGLETADASILFSVLLFGTIFSVPMGFITDKINRRILMLFSTIITLVCAILLSFSSDPKTMYTLLFLMFGFMIGIKLPAVILINEKYKPTQRLAVNSSFSRMCLIGNICGIFCTGAIMELVGSWGLWFSIIMILSLYLTFSIYNYYLRYKKHKTIFGSFFVKNNLITNSNEQLQFPK